MSENTSYVSLANKYRPQKFEDMVGQESISRTLKNALKLGRIAHAYLFYGPRGCGKTTTARILAKALNCTGNGHTKPTDEPCGECPQCREIAQSADMDVLELDAASNTQVEKVREAIIDTVALAASRDRFKVFILDEVHMLSDSSFNALLKTIEEPPAHVVFILATTEKHKVPATIVSRCQTFRFRPITVDEITNHLLDLAEAEGLDVTEKAARIIAKNAGGALRDALTLMDRAIAYSDGKIDEKLVGEMLGLTPQDLLAQTLTALVQKDTAGLHQVFETLRAEGFDANSFLKDVKNALGDLFYFALDQGTAPFDGADTLVKQVSSGLLAGLSRKVNKLAEEVKFSDNALVSAEVGLFTVMDSCFDVAGFIRRLEALERGESLPAQEEPPTGANAVKTPSAAAAITKAAPARKITKTVAPAVERKTAPVSAVPPAAQVIPTPVQSVPAVAAETPVQPTSTKTVFTDNTQIWKAVVKAFESSPFIYDALVDCQMDLNADEWTLLHFGKGKDFYRVPVQNKIPEIEKKIHTISGKTIRFRLAPAANTVKQTSASGAVTAKTEPISAEEPFVQADFSADVAKTNAANAPEELKDVLDIIGGEVLI